MDYPIIPMQPQHWPAVREIYREGIETGQATFATEPPGWEKWNRSHRKDCRLVALEPIAEASGDFLIPLGSLRVLGWAALSPASSRRVYSGVAEVSIYVAAVARGNGVGKRLLKALIEESEAHGVWSLQAGIFPENVASVALHKSCGFREVGLRRRIGKMGDWWRDTILLERRSSRVGL
ncbi:MAG: N-acetyltransferase family protein [Candidatus Sulfotelmatobacter sp.]